MKDPFKVQNGQIDFHVMEYEKVMIWFRFCVTAKEPFFSNYLCEGWYVCLKQIGESSCLLLSDIKEICKTVKQMPLIKFFGR